MKKTTTRIALIVLAVVIIISIVLSVDVDLNLRIRMKAHELLGSRQIVATAPGVYFLAENAVWKAAYTNELLKHNAETGKTFFDLAWLRESLYTYQYDQATEEIHLVGPSDHTVITKGGSITVNGNKIEKQIIPLIIEDEAFLPYEDVAELANFDSLGIRLREMKENGNAVFYNTNITYAELELGKKEPVFLDLEQLKEYDEKTTNAQNFYKLQSILEPVFLLEKGKAGKVVAFPDEEGWINVVTENNAVGIVKSSEERLQSIEEALEDPAPEEIRTAQEPLMLVWEAVYSYNPDTATIATMAGVNVVSPTWYELSNEAGKVSSKVSTNYIEWARQKGYQIWPLVSNGFDIERTHAFLMNAEARGQFIAKMVEDASLYGFEGINLDFENIYLADKDRLTHFVNELSYAMKEQGILLSMDVTIMGGSDNWSKCYDHEYLGKLVDYLIIMTYDEYWAASPISGPVASYDWVERNITDLAAIVKPEKLILGLPLYTRVWRERPSSELVNKMKTRSSAVNMTVQNEFIESKNLTPIWDDEAKLYFASFIDEDSLVKVWIENAETLSYKADLVNQLDLAGIACWQRSYATEEIWEALRNTVFEQ